MLTEKMIQTHIVCYRIQMDGTAYVRKKLFQSLNHAAAQATMVEFDDLCSYMESAKKKLESDS